MSIMGGELHVRDSPTSNQRMFEDHNSSRE